VSIENSRFTWRADELRDVPAAVRFISAEPLPILVVNMDEPKKNASAGWSFPRWRSGVS